MRASNQRIDVHYQNMRPLTLMRASLIDLRDLTALGVVHFGDDGVVPFVDPGIFLPVLETLPLAVLGRLDTAHLHLVRERLLEQRELSLALTVLVMRGALHVRCLLSCSVRRRVLLAELVAAEHLRALHIALALVVDALDHLLDMRANARLPGANRTLEGLQLEAHCELTRLELEDWHVAAVQPALLAYISDNQLNVAIVDLSKDHERLAELVRQVVLRGKSELHRALQQIRAIVLLIIDAEDEVIETLVRGLRWFVHLADLHVGQQALEARIHGISLGLHAVLQLKVIKQLFDHLLVEVARLQYLGYAEVLRL